VLFKYKFTLDKRRKLDNGKYPIKVNLHSYEYERNFTFKIPALVTDKFRIEFACIDTKEFDSIWTNREKKDNFGEVKGETTVYGSKFELRAALKIKADILDDLISSEGSWKKIKEKFIKHKPKKEVTRFYEAYELYIKNLTKEERHSTALVMQSALKRLKEFHPNPDLSFYDITVDFMNAYQKHRLRQGLAKATIGIEARYIRAVLNTSTNSSETLKKQYPFNGAYIIPTGERKNQGLEKSQLNKILNYSSDNFLKQRSRDLFIFSFLNGGMNFKDIVLLEKNQVEFKRSKVRLTAKKEVKIKLNDDPSQQAVLDEIVGRYKGESKYLFNFLDDKMDALAITRRAASVVNKSNEKLKEIANELGFKEDISTGWARHSNATILFESGLDLKTIGEGMGHTNLKTTEGYINSLIDKNKGKVSRALDIFDEDVKDD